MIAKQLTVTGAGQEGKKDKEKEKTEAAAVAAASEQPAPELPQPTTVSGMCACSLPVMFSSHPSVIFVVK